MPKVTADEQWVSEIRRGSQAAIEEYDARFGRVFFGYFLHRTKNERDAEEMSRDLLDRGAMTWKRDGGRNLENWLWFLARRLLVDYYRVHARETSLDELLEGAGEIPKQLQVPSQDGAEDKSANSPIAPLRAAVGKLPDSVRKVIELQLLDLSDEEIARLTNKKPSSVRVYRMRAIHALRKSLGLEE
jgi:DNA-directed RNA polymerase specialized sigma24 family protein